MNGILYLISTILGGSIGWWLGSSVGLMTAFVVSVVGTAAGVWATRRFIAHWMP